MKLISHIKLLPTSEQAASLRSTLERANAACNEISQFAWDHQLFGQFNLHHSLYQHIRAEYLLSAQLAVRCIGKVADAYKAGRDRQRTFKRHGAIAYDARILSYDIANQQVSIWTTTGRQRMSYAAGDPQQLLLASQRGESDLVYRNGEFFLLAVCDVEDPPTDCAEDVMGVDLGIVNLATTSDGTVISGEAVEQSRQWYLSRRATLQSVGTRSAKRHLRELSGKQKRFQRHTNHVISKQLVTLAKGTGRAIALEQLKGIRGRVTVRKGQRNRHVNWGFGQLRAFVSYKAQRSGVPVILVDPRDTSRMCHECGYCDKSNRRSQSEFLCQQCGHRAHADVNAALNIRARGAVNLPMVSVGYAR